MSDQSKELFHIISGVLWRCWVLGVVLLGVGFGASQLAHGFVTDLHGSMFGLSPHEIDVIFYCAFGLLKLCVIVCFFIPWLSLKLVMSKLNA